MTAPEWPREDRWPSEFDTAQPVETRADDDPPEYLTDPDDTEPVRR